MQTARAQSEVAKRLALVEQERDFLRRDLQAARDAAARRDAETGDAIRLGREKDEKIKSQRAKKKAMARELAELRKELAMVTSSQS